jgi:hypothetical protein
LIITRHDLIRFREWVADKWFMRQSSPAPVIVNPRMAALKQAKSRARDVSSDQVEIKEAPVEIQPAVSPPKEKEPPPVKNESTTSALLARKKGLKK